MKTTIYTIETNFYDNSKIQQFPDTEEGGKALWEAINDETLDGVRGKGDHFRVCRYEIDGEASVERSRNNTGKPKNSFQDYYSDNDSLVDEDGERLEPVNSVTVPYTDIYYDEDNNRWVDDAGYDYESEEEAKEHNKPENWLELP